MLSPCHQAARQTVRNVTVQREPFPLGLAIWTVDRTQLSEVDRKANAAKEKGRPFTGRPFLSLAPRGSCPASGFHHLKIRRRTRPKSRPTRAIGSDCACGLPFASTITPSGPPSVCIWHSV